MASQPKLGDYAMIGDCRTAALISREGSIDWLCLPDFGSPSLFARILDMEKGGFFSIALDELQETTRRYIPETAVLETTLKSSKGTIRLTDCMPVMQDMRGQPALQPLREILRRIEVLEGTPVIRLEVRTRPDYGTRYESFRNRGALGWALNYDGHLINLLTDMALTQDGRDLHGLHHGRAGESFWLSLTFERCNPGILMPLGKEAATRQEATVAWWRNWSAQCNYSGPWRDEVLRSAITLRLLTFAQSGALLAAATTSLPEKPGGWMNWDYRFCWPRDAAVTLSAFLYIGIESEASAFFDWLVMAANTTSPGIANMYDVYGRHEITEAFLPQFSGHRGAQPVRIGNAVDGQLQHDVYGEVLMAAENILRFQGSFTTAQRRLVEGFARVVTKLWHEPDNGIWEIRGERHHYTHSKVMCWSVFDTLIRMHEQGHIDGSIDRYRREREALREEIEREAFNSALGHYTAIYRGDTVDAALLLLPRTGFIAYDDPKMLATWEAIRRDLEVNGLILRYPPGFGGSQPGEGALMICNFWAVGYLHYCGRKEEARRRLEYLLTLANDVGLYNEATDVETLAPLGNMPQAFSHASLIIAIARMQGGQIKGEAG